MLKLFKGFAESKRELVELGHKSKELLKTDETLIEALFKPAVIEEYMSNMEWTDESCKDKAFSFSKSLLHISEYYINKNGVLSAALWGIWNTIQSMNTTDSFFKTLRTLQNLNEKDFVKYRSLAATAAVQFADGDARTIVTSSALNNIDKYKANVAEALEHLNKYAEEAERRKRRDSD